MTATIIVLDRDGIQDATYRFLGRFFIAFANIELNLALQVEGKASFQEKLESYYNMAITQHCDDENRFCELAAWYMAADSIRILRNRLAHGRWGFNVQAQCVIHVSGFPPGPQDERRFSLVELETIANDVESLAEELFDLVC